MTDLNRSWLLVLLIGCATTIVVGKKLDLQQTKATQTQLNADVEKRTRLIQKEIGNVESTLEDLASVYSIHPDMSREQFNRMVSPILDRDHSFSALGWDVLIKDENRLAFEQQAQSSGISSFAITQKASSGRLIKAGKRSEYFPVLFIEPLQGNEKAVGFDIASEPVRREAIESARRSKGFSVTAPVTLVQEDEAQKSVLACFPTYRSPANDESLSLDSKGPVTGIVVGVVRLGNLISDAIGHLDSASFDMQIIDVTNNHSPQDLCIGAEKLDGDVLTTSIKWGGRIWQLNYVPTPEYLRSALRWSPWKVNGVGFMFTTIISALVFVLSENSNRRTANRILQEDEERLRLVLDSAADGWWDWNVESDSVQYSEFWSEVLNCPIEREAPGFDGLKKLLSETDFRRRSCLMERCIAKETTEYHFELEIDVSGESRWMSERGQIVSWHHNERATRMVGTITDITLQKVAEAQKEKFENQIRESQKLDGLGLLAGGIAHDFNNYLTSIMGNTDLAELFIDDPAKRSDALHKIRDATASASRLTSQMLAYAGKGKIRNEIIDLKHVVDDMLVLLRPNIPGDVAIAFDHKGHATVDGNHGQIAQVVMNLITNAIDASGPQGNITISLDITTVDETNRPRGAIRRGKYSTLRVADDGCGMTKEVAAKIFEPFFTTKEKGHGLGLAAVNGIVLQHHGIIDLKSTENFGTMITVHLPYAGSTKRRQPGANQQNRPLPVE